MINEKILDDLLLNSNSVAWKSIEEILFNTFSPSFASTPAQEIVKREKEIVNLEALIAGSCWDLWNSFEKEVPKTSQSLVDFWKKTLTGKAIFIIDGLSLREMPLFLDEAQKRGYAIHQSKITASELPSDTTYFARSLGFGQRSALENNLAGNNHFLQGAVTELSDLPWRDCIQIISNEPNIVFWHTWFDDRIHEYKVPGKGLRELSLKSIENFTSNDFWDLVRKLSHGRRLIITSDHGYASTGDFTNVNGEQAEYLKTIYKSQRYSKNDKEIKIKSTPPIEIQLQNNNGLFSYALGRRKWKSSGGYPTLAHGGLSLMETMVPFIEISE